MMGFPKQWKYIYTSRPILTAQWTGYWTEHILQQYGFRTLSYGNISEDQDSDLATHNISDTFQIIMGREIGHQLGTGIIGWHILDTGQPNDIQQLQINWSMAKWAVFVQQRKSIKSFAISNPKPPWDVKFPSICWAFHCFQQIDLKLNGSDLSAPRKSWHSGHSVRNSEIWLQYLLDW